ncbi:hypothetical protein CQJ94_24795 [Glycomyces fuscus]|nr:hypothetical protein CQJ94_24795 [Glycomyces fuscus]
MLATIPLVWVPELPAWVLGLGFMPMYVAMALHWASHRGKLCAPCMASLPLQGPELAERWRRGLRTLHWVGDHPLQGILLACAAMMVTGLFMAPAGVSLFFVLCAISTLWAMRHARVMPWCHWCRRRGGGDEEESPVAPPSPTVNA